MKKQKPSSWNLEAFRFILPCKETDRFGLEKVLVGKDIKLAKNANPITADEFTAHSVARIISSFPDFHGNALPAQ